MLWVYVSVAAAFAGLAVLAVCAVKVFAAVHALGRELERARRELRPKQTALRDELRTFRDAQDFPASQDGVRST